MQRLLLPTPTGITQLAVARQNAGFLAFYIEFTPCFTPSSQRRYGLLPPALTMPATRQPGNPANRVIQQDWQTGRKLRIGFFA
jgi:hypothetical protein